MQTRATSRHSWSQVAFVGGVRGIGQAEPALHVGARGMGEVIPAEVASLHHGFDGGESCFGAVAHAEGDSAIQGGDGRRVDPTENVIEPDDLRQSV
jgi:hypothetical protein